MLSSNFINLAGDFIGLELTPWKQDRYSIFSPSKKTINLCIKVQLYATLNVISVWKLSCCCFVRRINKYLSCFPDVNCSFSLSLFLLIILCWLLISTRQKFSSKLKLTFSLYIHSNECTRFTSLNRCCALNNFFSRKSVSKRKKTWVKLVIASHELNSKHISCYT